MSPRTKIQNDKIRAASEAKIRQAAFELFGKEGYKQTTLEQIAKKAGVSKGLLYNYFDGKEGVLRSILDTMMAKGMESVFMEESSHPKERLRFVIDGFFNHYAGQVDMMRIMIPLALQVRDFEFVNDLIAKKTSSGISYLNQIFEDLGYEDPEGEAWKLASLLDGIAMHIAVMGESYDLENMRITLNKTYQL